MQLTTRSGHHCMQLQAVATLMLSGLCSTAAEHHLH